MDVQMYYMKLKSTPPDKTNVIGGPVYSQNSRRDSFGEEIPDGFLFDYNPETNIAGFCFFYPIEITDPDTIEDILYSEEEVDHDVYMDKMFAANPDARNHWSLKETDPSGIIAGDDEDDG
jgi:hypothetical protein